MSALIRLGLGGALLLTLGLGSAPAPQGGSYVTLGYGEPATRVAMLGLHPGAAVQGGSYITLGYGESASRAAMLGLSSAPAAPVVGGSYITFGQGQSASKFAMLGLTPSAFVPPIVIHPGGGSIRIPVDALTRARLQRDDELILFVIAGAVATGMLN